MKKIFLQMLLRAAQTAVIAFFAALIVNYFVINAHAPAKGNNFNFNWVWIINSILISIFVFVSLLAIEKASWKGKIFYDGVGTEGIFGFILAGGVAIVHNIDVLYKYHLSEWISLSAFIIAIILAVFWKQSSRSILFAVVFSGIYGIFYSLHFGTMYDFFFSCEFMIIAIVSARIIRFIFIFLFVKEHKFLEEDKAKMKVLK